MENVTHKCLIRFEYFFFFGEQNFFTKHDALFISFDENSRLFLNEFECIRYFPSLAQLKKFKKSLLINLITKFVI